MIEHLHALVEAALLGQIADPVQQSAMKSLAKQADFALIGHGDADHHADGRGLARAVRSQQPVHAARTNGQRKIVHGHKVVVGFADSPQLYKVSHKSSFEFQVSSFEQAPTSHKFRSSCSKVGGVNPRANQLSR